MARRPKSAPMPKCVASISARRRDVLRLRNVDAWYGCAHVLQGVDLDVAQGEVVADRPQRRRQDSLLRAIMGLMPRCEGEIGFRRRPAEAADTRPFPSRSRLRAGRTAHRAGPSVAENIELGLIAPAACKRDPARVEEVLAMFPPCANAGGSRRRPCRAANSRCWRSPVRWFPDRSC